MLEKVCEDLPKEEATTMLCEQISAIQGVKGTQLAELLSQRLRKLGSDSENTSFSRSLSNAFQDVVDNGKQAEDREAMTRLRFSWAEKM